MISVVCGLAASGGLVWLCGPTAGRGCLWSAVLPEAVCKPLTHAPADIKSKEVTFA